MGFPIDFSVGPINNMHKESGIKDYFSWLAASFHQMWESFEVDQPAYQQAVQQ
ncbi:DUF1835 domain-containing protein [Oceanobacillus arenosus]|uniref:DUF1835 domain-containing protein n=1 Tax=Oceanobacillus arenosus TaxID=1229153 RepID=UPI000E2198C7